MVSRLATIALLPLLVPCIWTKGTFPRVCRGNGTSIDTLNFSTSSSRKVVNNGVSKTLHLPFLVCDNHSVGCVHGASEASEASEGEFLEALHPPPIAGLHITVSSTTKKM